MAAECAIGSTRRGLAPLTALCLACPSPQRARGRRLPGRRRPPPQEHGAGRRRWPGSCSTGWGCLTLLSPGSSTSACCSCCAPPQRYAWRHWHTGPRGAGGLGGHSGAGPACMRRAAVPALASAAATGSPASGRGRSGRCPRTTSAPNSMPSSSAPSPLLMCAGRPKPHL
jgi:hypothetical protein